MLDLTTALGTLYQIKMADGEVLNLRRPTQALQQSIVNLQKYGSDADKIEEAMSGAINIFTRILNRNTESKEFTEEEVAEEYDYTVALMVITDYLKFYAKEVASKVPFQPAQ